jgi:hypothetical protein
MRCLLFLLFFGLGSAVAQIPRTTAGLFEYSGEVSGGNTSQMKEKAQAFFNQPFLVHWDSIARSEHEGNTLVTGAGYITIAAKKHSVGLPSEVPVSLQFSIEVKEGRYKYTINHFRIEQFALEQKPDSIKSLAYHQLLERTHKRMTFVIGWMKRYMHGQE